MSQSQYGKSGGDGKSNASLAITGTGMLGESAVGGMSMGVKKSGRNDKYLDECKEKIKHGVMLDANREYVHETHYKKKERVGFGGGFKIPEEYKKKRIARKFQKVADDEEGTEEEKDTNTVTREDIIAQLKLGDSQMKFGSGKATSKGALTKDLVEGLDADLVRLKRTEDNLKLSIRKLARDPSVNENDEQIQKKMNVDRLNKLKEAGGHIYPFEMSEPRVQLLRHQPGQLKSLKNYDFDELESARMTLVKEREELEELLYASERTKGIGGQIRKGMGYDKDESPLEEDSREDLEDDEAEEYDESPSKRRKRKKGGKTVRIVEDRDDHLMKMKEGRRYSDDSLDEKPVRGKKRDSSAKPRKSSLKQDIRGSPDTKVRSRSQKSGGVRSRSQSQTATQSPRRTLYEAKFEKYLANKVQKDAITQRVKTAAVPNFDLTTKDQGSPSRWRNHFKPTNTCKFNEDDLMPEGYDDYLVREEILRKKKREQEEAAKRTDPFKVLGVSGEDKMTFFLLKWVFNAIRQTSDKIDPKLKGADFVDRKELVKQLAKNTELMHALEFDSSRQLWKQLAVAAGVKPTCFTWEEYMDFFFLRNKTFQDRIDGNDWWNAKEFQDKGDKSDDDDKSIQTHTPRSDESNNEDARSDGSRKRRKRIHDTLLRELESVKMTPALELLIETRRKKTAQQVEEEFNDRMEAAGMGMTHQKAAGGKKKQGGVDLGFLGQDEDALNASLGFSRDKSKNLLLPSQYAVMQEIFETMDNYNDGILARSKFVMSLRMDGRIVDFIHQDAVKVAPPSTKVLTLEQVLAEIERDEAYERSKLNRNDNDICHKEFVTWREFMTYFDDYRDVDDRNQKVKQIGETRKNMQKMKQPGTEMENSDPAQELKTLMEAEKERRLQDLPQIRPADMIDISEEQLKLIKDVYQKSAPKDGTSVHSVTFFMGIRKHPKIKAISSAMARDPEGHSRLARETFQQVFDRMERDTETKTIEWHTIVEFFTKRGKPLSKDELLRLQGEDKKMKEEQEEQLRRAEDIEKRREARLDEDLAEHEDFDTYKTRQDNDDDPGVKFNLGLDDEEDDRREKGSDDNSDSEYDDEYDEEDDLNRDNHSDDGQRRRRRRRDDDDSDEDFMRDGEKGNKGRKRLRSAKQNIPDRISGADYAQVSQREKGKYGVTVPLPFGFDAREQTKPMTIRGRKVEAMVNEKLQEEEKLIKHQFKCKPIPPECIIPRFQAICDNNDRRRESTKRNSLSITKQREAPFSFWDDIKRKQAAERDPDAGVPDDALRPNFKANPIPLSCSVSNYAQNLEQEKKQREQRIRKAAENSKSRAKMPPRMERASKEDKPGKSMTQLGIVEPTFQPKVNQSKTAEQMKKAQDKFQEALEMKKSQFTGTVVKEFPFRESKTKPLEREHYNEGDPKMRLAKGMTAFDQQMLKSKQTAKMSRGPVPDTTKAITLAQEARRKQIEAQRKKEADEEKLNAARDTKKNRLKSQVQSSYADTLGNSKKIQRENAKEKRDDFVEKAAEQKRNIDEIKEKGRRQPMLSDTRGVGKRSNLAKLQATKNFLEGMKQAGLSKEFAMGSLSEEQRALLSEEAYVDRIKNQRAGKS